MPDQRPLQHNPNPLVQVETRLGVTGAGDYVRSMTRERRLAVWLITGGTEAAFDEQFKDIYPPPDDGED